MAWLEEKKKDILREIFDLAVENVDKLSSYWLEMHEPKRCEEHLERIVDHARTFFKDIIEETEERRNCFIRLIADRKEEASNLRRLLKVDIDLGPIDQLPLHTALVRMENDLQELRQSLKERQDEIKKLLLEQENFCEELGTEPRELRDDPLPSEQELQVFRDHLETLRIEKSQRIDLVANLRTEIKSYLNDLEINPDLTTDSVFINSKHIPLTEESIRKLQAIRDDYENQVREVRNSIETMKSKVDKLWSYLSVSPSIRKKFSKYTDYTQTTYDRYREELARCETHKLQNIKKFVDAVRLEIEQWWDKTLKSDAERARFPYFLNECYSEDLLTLHEMELENLKQFYSDNEAIFDLFQQRQTLWDRMIAIEAKASEPGRYNNRGGQLLKEEKERKLIASKLPKIEAELTTLVNEYEAANNIKFLVFGEDILELMSREWEEKRVEKEKLMSARKNAIGPGKTPLSKSTVFRTPLVIRNQSTMKKTVSSVNLTAQPSTLKRKRVGDEPEENIAPNAKRNLFQPLTSPRSVDNRTAVKSSAKKPRVIASTIVKRRSGRMSGSKRRSINKTPGKIPIIKMTKAHASDTTSYDAFQDHIESDPSCRSSISANGILKAKTRIKSRQNRLVSPHPLGRSPGRSPANPTRKLTTKNIPILI